MRRFLPRNRWPMGVPGPLPQPDDDLCPECGRVITDRAGAKYGPPLKECCLAYQGAVASLREERRTG
jgi:hypothetical protein